MALTVVAGDTRATAVTSGAGSEEVDMGVTASASNGAQRRKVIADMKGIVAGFRRETDNVQTGLQLISPDGSVKTLVVANNNTVSAS